MSSEGSRGSGSELPGDTTRTTSLRAPAGLIEDFDDAIEDAGYGSRTEALVDLMQQTVDEYGGRDEYLPADPNDRDLYLSCLELANDRFRMALRRVESRLAQETGVPADKLTIRLYELEKQGYVRQYRGVGAIRGKDNAGISYRVKPPAADPERWTYRKR